MKLKAGVNLEGVSWRMFYAAVIAEPIWEAHGAPELVITSANDGKHGNKTLHHKGLALDLRTWTLARKREACDALQAALGAAYDVVLESDHAHVEWDPKPHA